MAVYCPFSGVRLNAQGRSALQLAADGGHQRCVELLVGAGAHEATPCDHELVAEAVGHSDTSRTITEQ